MTAARVDWEQVHRRLQAADQAFEQSLADTPARIEAAFRERAARLAKKPVRRALASTPALIVVVCGERYAVELKDIAEVLPFGQCTPVPGAGRELLGVINTRGELRTVLDPAVLLGVPRIEPAHGGFVLVGRTPQGTGVKVDNIDALCEFRAEEMKQAASAPWFKGIAGANVPLLDIDKLLAVDGGEESLGK